MNDMISRQAAIDEVQHIYSVIKGTDVLVKNPDAVFQNICNFLASLPSVGPEPDWNEMIVICDCCGHTIQVKKRE